jgi:hypothetical protein
MISRKSLCNHGKSRKDGEEKKKARTTEKGAKQEAVSETNGTSMSIKPSPASVCVPAFEFP